MDEWGILLQFSHSGRKTYSRRRRHVTTSRNEGFSISSQFPSQYQRRELMSRTNLVERESGGTEEQ